MGKSEVRTSNDMALGMVLAVGAQIVGEIAKGYHLFNPKRSLLKQEGDIRIVGRTFGGTLQTVIRVIN